MWIKQVFRTFFLTLWPGRIFSFPLKISNDAQVGKTGYNRTNEKFINLKSDDQQDRLDGSHVGQQTVNFTAKTDQSTVHQHGDEPHYFHNVLKQKKIKIVLYILLLKYISISFLEDQDQAE